MIFSLIFFIVFVMADALISSSGKSNFTLKLAAPVSILMTFSASCGSRSLLPSAGELSPSSPKIVSFTLVSFLVIVSAVSFCISYALSFEKSPVFSYCGCFSTSYLLS